MESRIKTRLRPGGLLLCSGLLCLLCNTVATADEDRDALRSRIERLEKMLEERAADERAAADDGGGSDDGGDSSDDSEERLKDLSDKVDDLSDSFEQFSSDKTIVHSGTSRSTMKAFGRIHIDGWGFADADDNIAIFNGGGRVPTALDPQNRLGFRRLRIGVQGDLPDNMFYKIVTEFAGGNDFEFRDAFLGWEELPYLHTLTLGNHKRPYGLDHLNSSRYNIFIERPYVIEAFNQDARRLGISSRGYSQSLLFNWRYGVYNQRNIQGLGNYIDDHLQLELAGRLAMTPWYDEISGGRGYAHFAISGTVADPDPNAILGNEARFRTRPEARSSGRWIDTGRIAFAEDYQLLGVESVINLGALQLVAEYQTTAVNRTGGFDDVNFDGGYVYASYFLTGEHMPWNRRNGTLGRPIPLENFWAVRDCAGSVRRGWGAWQVAVRYSTADFNDGVLGNGVFGGQGDAWTFGLNWWWNPNARMQFNYINGQIANRLVSDPGDPTAAPPVPPGPLDNTLQSGDYSIYGVRFMVDY
ncbi:OprO/OprP family phosphate-selective porin [Roseimaritima sediminicola]|uniref:OprO/OprP family phosphate-selective porin n=1 Tax=Roseimaritima sediminicola TaxID=2662066 RepID=UPI001F1CC0F2|nr:porin [Roseimaritima sediminicola]